MPTHFFHSGMAGAPTNTNAAGSTLAIIDAILVTGFNLQSVLSASVASEVMTVSYAIPHGYEDKVLIRLDGAAGGSIVRRATVTGAQVLTIPAPGFADGAVAGTLSTRVAPADWERVFSDTGRAVFRSKATGPGCTRFYYRVSDTSSGEEPRILRGYESMTDIDTGVGPFPTVAQEGGGGVVRNRAVFSSAALWAAVLDGRTCYLFISRADAAQVMGSFFGDCSPYGAADLFFAGLSGTNITTSPIASSSSWYLPRGYSGAGNVATGSNLHGFGGAVSGLRQAYPSSVDGGMPISRPVLVQQGGFVRGEMRGLMDCAANPIPSSAFFTVMTGVQGVDGRVLVVRAAYGVQDCVAFPVDEDWP